MFSYKGIVIPLAAEAGVEPANLRVKAACLTAWLLGIEMAAKPLEKILTFHLAAFGTTIISDKIWRLSFYRVHSICSNMFPLMKTKVSLKPKPHILSLLSRKVSNLSVKLLNDTKIANGVAVRE